MTAPDEVRGLLARAAHRRVEAENARADAMDDLGRALVAGHAAGIPVAELARLAGVTRQTVYDVLRRAG